MLTQDHCKILFSAVLLRNRMGPRTTTVNLILNIWNLPAQMQISLLTQSLIAMVNRKGPWENDSVPRKSWKNSPIHISHMF